MVDAVKAQRQKARNLVPTVTWQDIPKLIGMQ